MTAISTLLRRSRGQHPEVEPAWLVGPVGPTGPAGGSSAVHVRWWRTYGRVTVEGRSMLPAYQPGDWLVVHYGAPVRPGDVVLARRPDRPELIVLKRAVRATPEGWWLLGDNAAESDDSRVFGAVPHEDVLARVLRRYGRAPTGG